MNNLELLQKHWPTIVGIIFSTVLLVLIWMNNHWTIALFATLVTISLEILATGLITVINALKQE